MELITNDTYCLRSEEDFKLLKEFFLKKTKETPRPFDPPYPIEFPCIVYIHYDSMYTLDDGYYIDIWPEYTYLSDIELLKSYLIKENNNDEHS